MTHGLTVNLVLDSTKPSGVLYHVLTEATRGKVKTFGQEYHLAHSRGDVPTMDRIQADILAAVR